MNTAKRWTVLGAMAGTLMTAVVQAFAAGAIASGPGEKQYGYSYDHGDLQSAEMRALHECGDGCIVVLRYQTGCGAHAVDRTPGSGISGLGLAKTKTAALDSAMWFCRSSGGRQCAIKAWSCNWR